ncbi:MAG: adenosylcobinamide amidohydrolase [Methanosphaera sp.]|nr:adenosylcobinamide amidohydrolase [Methanosphaera sp.]
MTTNYSEEIFETNFFKIIKKDDALILNLKQDNNVLISSWLNGGLKHNMKNIVNQSISDEDYNMMANGDFDSFQEYKFQKLNLSPLTSAGLITSACMDNYAISTKKYEKLEVTSIITAGADKNAVKAGDKASFYEYNNHYFSHFGTINIITIINANLEDGALVTASITATEAKSSIIQDLKIESQYSNFIATGTGTDGIAIISNKNSENHIENAGKHSKLGELIATSIRDALKKALYLQTFMSIDYQSTVLSRLSRFNILFDDFYEQSSETNKIAYASKFYHFNNNKENVSFISSIVNLIDEVQLQLLTWDDVETVIKQLIKYYLNVEVPEKKLKEKKDVLNLLIKSVNLHLFD